MYEIVLVIVAVAIGVFVGRYFMEKRYCPECKNVLSWRVFPDTRAIEEKKVIGASGFFECLPCNKYYSVIETRSVAFDKKKDPGSAGAGKK